MIENGDQYATFIRSYSMPHSKTCPGKYIVCEKDNYKHCQFLVMTYLDDYFDLGLIATLLFFILGCLVVARLIYHIRIRSHTERVLIHFVFLLIILCNIAYYMLFLLLPSDFCFVFHHFYYLTISRYFGIYLLFFLLIWTVTSWSSILNVDMESKPFIVLGFRIHLPHFLYGVAIFQCFWTILLSVKIGMINDIQKFHQFVYDDQVYVGYLCSAVGVSVLISGSLLIYCGRLQWRLKTLGIETYTFRKSIFQVNLAIALIVFCLILRSCLLMPPILHPGKEQLFSSCLLETLASDIIPTLGTLSSLLYLYRRKQHACSNCDRDYSDVSNMDSSRQSPFLSCSCNDITLNFK